MYIQKGTVELIPQALPMAFPLSHVEEQNFCLLSVACYFHINLGSNKLPKYFTK